MVAVSRQTCVVDLHRTVAHRSPDTSGAIDRLAQPAHAGGRRADVHLGEAAPGVCTITLTFRGVPTIPEGSTLLLELKDGESSCSGGTLPFNHRPAACRTGLPATP